MLIPSAAQIGKHTVLLAFSTSLKKNAAYTPQNDRSIHASSMSKIFQNGLRRTSDFFKERIHTASDQTYGRSYFRNGAGTAR